MNFAQRVLAVVVGTVVAASDSSASILIFEPSSGSYSDFGSLPQGYGSRIVSTNQGGFKYDLTGGATPNVVTQFGAPAGLADLFTWNANFGDLQHVVIAREPFQFEMRLVADAGYAVTLNSFDMAGWPNLDFPEIASVRVEDGTGNVLFSQPGAYIQGDGTGPQHTHFSFSGVTAPELRVIFDSRTNGRGTVLDSDDVGIDNIAFSQARLGSQAVPEPGSLAVVGLSVAGVVGTGLRRWRRSL